MLRCALLSFLTYFVPLALLRRKLRDRHHLRASLAFGAFSGTYRAVRLLVARLRPQLNRSAPFFAGAAGAIATTAIDPSFVSSLFVTWWCVRALRSLPAVAAFQASRYGPALVMCAATDVLAPAGFDTPQDHQVSYRKVRALPAFPSIWVSSSLRQFFDTFFQVNGDSVERFRHPPPGVSIAQNLVATSGTPFWRWQMLYLWRVALQAVRIYAPLHLVWAVFRLPARTPLRVLFSNTLRSTAFLTAYVVSLQVILLTNSQLVGGRPQRAQLHLWCWISGLSVLLERSSRQAELAFFCASQAVNSLYNHAKRVGLVQPSHAVGVALLALATGQVRRSGVDRPAVARF